MKTYSYLPWGWGTDWMLGRHKLGASSEGPLELSLQGVRCSRPQQLTGVRSGSGHRNCIYRPRRWRFFQGSIRGQSSVKDEIKVLCRPLPLHRPCLFGCQAVLHPLTKHTCAYTCAQVLTHTHVCICTHMRAHTHTHSHARTHTLPSLTLWLLSSLFPSQPSLNRVDRESPFGDVFIGPHLTPREVAQAHRTKSTRFNGLLV